MITHMFHAHISHEVSNTINPMLIPLRTHYYLLYTPSKNHMSLRSDLDFSDIEALLGVEKFELGIPWCSPVNSLDIMDVNPAK